jgi:hypothetical protein
MIKQISLAHGWYYHYRIHSDKTNKLCNNGFSELNSYLNDIMDDCPDEHFINGPRSSALRFSLPIKLDVHENHEVSRLCEEGLKTMDNYKTAHSKVQMFMLHFDKSSISVEAPIWINDSELTNFENIFKEKGALSGHIDVIRVEDDGKIWIWDYKPKAEKEKYASTQVFFYALMTSQRTGIPLEKFMCGYFDENIAYTFKPKLDVLENF